MDLEIFAESVQCGTSAGALQISGSAIVDVQGSDPLSWTAQSSFGALADAKHQACKDAAVAAAAVASYTVGALDKKNLWSGVLVL